jgi:hypothetical protein
MNINTSPNTKRCEINDVRKMVNFYNLVGDIVEFGTFSCESAIRLSTDFKDRKIYTIDHFEGLEKTSKNLPKGSDWSEGMFNLSHPELINNSRVPKTKEEALAKLSPYSNITMIISDVHKLTEPKDYNIGKIAAVNLDVDIYEPSVSSLEFVSKCEWNELFIRFDDWHGGESEYDEHERLAFTEWINKYGYKYNITHGGYIGGVYVKR